VSARLRPGVLTLVHPTGAVFTASTQAVDRQRLASGETQVDVDLPLTFVGPDGLSSLDVDFVLRVIIDGHGVPTATVVGASCSPSGA